MKNKNNIVLLGLLFLVLLTLVYAVYIYAVVNSDVGGRYIALLLLVGCALGLILWRGNDVVKQYCSIVLVSIFVAAYLAEVYLVMSQDSRQKQAEKLGVEFDIRHPLDFKLDYQKSNGKIHYIYQLARIGKDIDWKPELHPLGFPSGTMVFGKNEGGQYPVYQLDERGFNNPPNSWGKDNEALVVGDSFAFGYGVPQPYDVGGFLRESGVATLNLGISGNGPLSELGCLVEYLAHVKPKAVFWLYYPNDLVDLSNELENPFLSKYVDTEYSQDLFGRQAAVDGVVSRMLGTMGKRDMERYKYHRYAESPLVNIVKLKTLRGALRSLSVKRKGTEAHKEWKLFSSVLARAKSLCEVNGAKLIFVYLPEWAEVGKGEVDREKVLAVASGLGIKVLDYSRNVYDHPDPKSLYSLRYNSHFNAEGNRRLAEFLAGARQ